MVFVDGHQQADQSGQPSSLHGKERESRPIVQPTGADENYWITVALEYRENHQMFRDREEAGHLLAGELREFALTDPLVLGIPRGGVVIAARIARELNAELDVILARKLRAPWQRELAVGSVAEDGEVYLTSHADRVPGLTEQYIEQESNFQRSEIKRRSELFRTAREPAHANDRSVIVTDDGLATGSTMIAALEAISHQQPRELIAALPVAPSSRIDCVARRCDHFVCLHHPVVYYSVGQFYENFDEVTDAQVLELLRTQGRANPTEHASTRR